MVEAVNNLNLAPGLNIVYSNNENTLLNGEVSVYPTGEMMAEFAQIDPKTIKNVIQRCGDLHIPFASEAASEKYLQFYSELRKAYGHASSCLIAAEFLNTIGDWAVLLRSNEIETAMASLRENSSKDIMDYIFSDSGYSDVGVSDFGQALLSAYLSFSSVFVGFKYTFQSLLDENSEKARSKAIELLMMLGHSCMSMQQIDFKFILLEGKYQPLYTIKSAFSLLLFECVHCIELEANFVRCKNCGRIFMPAGRKDTIYCSYPSPQNPQKPCNVIGAQVAMANKEKNDIVTKTYRKIYHRYKSAERRHPGEIKYIRALQSLTEGMKEWREKLKNGSATTEMFLEWIDRF